MTLTDRFTLRERYLKMILIVNYRLHSVIVRPQFDHFVIVKFLTDHFVIVIYLPDQCAVRWHSVSVRMLVGLHVTVKMSLSSVCWHHLSQMGIYISCDRLTL